MARRCHYGRDHAPVGELGRQYVTSPPSFPPARLHSFALVHTGIVTQYVVALDSAVYVTGDLGALATQLGVSDASSLTRVVRHVSLVCAGHAVCADCLLPSWSPAVSVLRVRGVCTCRGVIRLEEGRRGRPWWMIDSPRLETSDIGSHSYTVFICILWFMRVICGLYTIGFRREHCSTLHDTDRIHAEGSAAPSVCTSVATICPSTAAAPVCAPLRFPRGPLPLPCPASLPRLLPGDSARSSPADAASSTSFGSSATPVSSAAAASARRSDQTRRADIHKQRYSATHRPPLALPSPSPSSSVSTATKDRLSPQPRPPRPRPP